MSLLRDIAKHEVRLLVDVQDDAFGSTVGTKFLQLRAMFVQEENGEWLYPSSSYSHDDLYPIAGLNVTAQLDNFAADFYGMKLCYVEESHVELVRAETMARTLRFVHTRLERFDVSLGVARDVVDVIARVANVLGVTDLGVLQRDMNSTSGRIVITQRWLDVDQLRLWLSDQIDAWRARHGIERAS